MAIPPWWEELVGVSDILVDADRAEVESWQGVVGDTVAEDQDDVPPLTVRLGTLGTAYGEHAAEFTSEQTQRLFQLLEEILVKGREEDGNAVATGFFEALLNAWDKGLDLSSVWAVVGPQSRAYCLAWNAFTGVDTPGWMR
ncbi:MULTISPECIES: DUF7674 family protein [Streptomycetaceae]|uniref:DUF7674 family protein n=1 Tax=Streptomycetaceae TaxID=2062 RepID=UPI0006AFDD17|nr:hypothetical protein [Streptomyces sp. XY431]